MFSWLENLKSHCGRCIKLVIVLNHVVQFSCKTQWDASLPLWWLKQKEPLRVKKVDGITSCGFAAAAIQIPWFFQPFFDQSAFGPLLKRVARLAPHACKNFFRPSFVFNNSADKRSLLIERNGATSRCNRHRRLCSCSRFRRWTRDFLGVSEIICTSWVYAKKHGSKSKFYMYLLET